MSHTRTRMRASAIVLTSAVAGALLILPGGASAASRGYRVHNQSNRPLRLESATHVPTVVCNQSICVPTHHPMDFEGRPTDGTVLEPAGRAQAWELKYGFGLTYAAKLTYKIVGTDGTVEFTIETSTFTNDSACKVIPANVGHCTGEGLTLAFRN
jgi:hypothetical protein